MMMHVEKRRRLTDIDLDSLFCWRLPSLTNPNSIRCCSCSCSLFSRMRKAYFGCTVGSRHDKHRACPEAYSVETTTTALSMRTVSIASQLPLYISFLITIAFQVFF